MSDYDMQKRKYNTPYNYIENLKIKVERSLVDGTMSIEDARKLMKLKSPLRVQLGESRIMSLNDNIDVDKILKEVEQHVDDNLSWRRSGVCQIMLQGVKVDGDPYFGSREFKEIAEAGYKEKDFIIPLFPGMNYTNKLLKEFKMFRSRLMLLKPKTCLSWHHDPSMRMHIPLVGDSDSFHIIEDLDGNKIVHQIEIGKAHLMNTEVNHSGINLSRKVERIHIVGCVNVD
jgi:hypothetical protein